MRKKLQNTVAKQLKDLKLELKYVEDEVVKIKLREVAKQLKEAVVGKRKIDEKKILNVLRLSELIGEIRNVRKK